MSHQAVIVELKNVRPHPNADRLLLADCIGYQVVVGLDSKEGDIGVFFYPELQLSVEYATTNDLIRRKNPETGENEGGMFDANRRVRSQKFRGEKSEGYFAPLDSLSFIGSAQDRKNAFPVGHTFDTISGVPICNKYVTAATQRAIAAGQKKFRKQNKCFPKHVETEKLQFAIDDIPEGSIIYITEKLHGTSGRYGLVRDEKELPRTFWQKIFRKPAKKTNEYDYLIGTRNMILGKSDKPSYYGKEEFRYNVMANSRSLLRKGEIVYGEIVGYTTNGALIMGEQDTSPLKDIKKKYGPKMRYTYGMRPGEHQFFVYRIVQVNDDGETVELSWPQVKRRAKELMLDTVPELTGANIINEELPHLRIPPMEPYDKQDLAHVMNDYPMGDSTLDESHIREGIVVRVEQPDGKTEFYKAKSFTFGVLEGYIKNDDDYIDVEEIA
jgi:hypothetical protein